MTAPTGEDNGVDRFGQYPQPFQLSSGAWNFFGGLVMTKQNLNFQWDTQVSYRANRQANNFEAGDEFRIDASAQKRIWPRRLTSQMSGFLYGVLEVNMLRQGKQRIRDVSNDNSGGSSIWIAPGIQYVTRRWVLEAVLQKPILQNLNGTALENDYIFTTSFRVNF